MSVAPFSSLDSFRDRIIHIQRELTRRPALGPENNGTGETEKAAWLVDFMKGIGLSEIREHPCSDDRVPTGFRPNISAKVPGKDRRTLWLIGHMDVVPVGDRSLWKTDPFELAVDGDYVIGRGVEDNQQAIVTGLVAAEALLKAGAVPDLSLGLLFVADEETGMVKGLPHVLESAPELIGPEDLILVSDMGNDRGSMVEVAEKSCLWLRFIVTGKQCHASTPEAGVNSLVASSALVLELEELYRRFREKDPLYSPSWSTFVPTKKEANVENVNTIPGRDVFYLDCRVLPNYTLNDVIAKCRELADAVEHRFGVTVAIEEVHREQAPTPTPVDAPVVQRLLAALKEVRNVEGNPCGVGGQTVAAPLRHRGYSVVVWGTLVPNAHTPNERSGIGATLDDAKVLVRMLYN